MPATNEITVGKFTFDRKTGVVSGPKEYMEERGSARIRSIEDGQDVVFNFGVTSAPDVFTAVLVSLQTDYASWRGARQLFLMGRR